MGTVQPDIFVDAEDRRIASSSRSLSAIAARLTAINPDPLIKVSEAARSIPVDPEVVYAWIDQGSFEYMDVGGGKSGKPYYMINRAGFLEFLATRLNKIGDGQWKQK